VVRQFPATGGRAHITALRFAALEWSAGGGWSMDSDRRTGPYLRLGFSARY
jgi:hypothetical protein